MSIISGIVRRPVSMLIAVVLLSILSLFTVTKISTNIMPDVTYPEMMVYTIYPGANPETVEEMITKPIEDAVRGLQKVKKVTSHSYSGTSVVTIETKYGSDMNKMTSEVQSRIDRVKSSFPKEVAAPVVLKFSGSDYPAVEVMVTSNRNINDVRQYINDNLLPYFEQIPGVARVEVSGGIGKQVLVGTSVNRLNAFGLTLSSIQNAIRNNGERTSLGYIQTETTDLALVLDNKFDNFEELKNLVIENRTTDSGQTYPIKLQDVADITFGYDEFAANINTINGRPLVQLNLYKLTGTSVVDIAKETKQMLKNIEKIAPKDFEFILFDQNAKFIETGMKAVGGAAAGGGLLGIIILLLFLRNFRSVLVIALSMPISILFTFMLMYFTGMTLNFMSLAGLTLGIGMLVDNSVVVLEHIYNKRLRGIKSLPASEYGAREMARPVLASTLTTVLVFVPVLLFKNELGVTIGGFILPLAFTVVVAIISSYFVAIFFVPVLTSKYIQIYQVQPKGIFKYIDRFLEFCLVTMNHSYQKRLRIMLEKPKRSLLLIIILVTTPVVFFMLNMPRIEQFPVFAPASVDVFFMFPTSTSKEVNHEYVQDFIKRTEYIFEKYGATGDILVNVNGRSEGGLFSSNSSGGSLRIVYKRNVTRNIHNKIVKEYQAFTNIYPGVKIFPSYGGSGGRGGGRGGNTFSLEVKSNDYNTLIETVTKYKNLLIKNFDDKITNITDDQKEGAPEYSLKVNRELANTYGVSISALVQELQSAVTGRKVNTYKEGASEYDIFVRLNAEDRSRPDLVEQLYVNGNGGVRIPVANLVDRNFGLGVSQIRRSNFKRTIVISGSLIPPYTVSQVVPEVRKKLKSLPENNKVVYFFTGEFENLKKDFKSLIIVFLLAVLFIYGVMASQFESFLDPFIIMFTVPLTLSGVLLIYTITQNTITLFTVIGVVMLVGIAVNHGIVLVDYMNLLRNRGYKLKDAIVAGCENRLQPILMTTATTVIGLLPLVILDISGIEIIKPLAITVAGGLSSSALLSLFFIPLIYQFFKKKEIHRDEKREKRHKIKEEQALAKSKKFNEEFNLVKNDETSNRQ